MGRSFTPWEVDKQWLLHPSVHDKLPPGHLATFMCDFVREVLDLDAVAATYDGNLAYPPHYPPMMVALHLYAWCDGLLGSRRIARACEQRVDFMALTAMEHLEFDDVRAFRERHASDLVAALVSLSRACRRLGVELGLDAAIAEDALPAAAAAVLERARAADTADDERFGEDDRGDEPPKWLIDKPKRVRRLKEARVALEDEAKKVVARAASKARGEDDDKTGFIRAMVDDDEPEPPRREIEHDDHPLARRNRARRAQEASRPADFSREPAVRSRPGTGEQAPPEPMPVPRTDRASERHQRPEPIRPAPPEPPRRDRPPTDHGAARPVPAAAPPDRGAPRPRTPTGSYRPSDAPQEISLTKRSEAERLRVVETVVATALSDGHIATVEERRIDTLVRVLRLDPRSRQHIFSLVRDKISPELPTAEELPDYDLRLHVFEQAAIMALVDGYIAPGEHAHLRELAGLLDLHLEDAKAALMRANLATDSRR